MKLRSWTLVYYKSTPAVGKSGTWTCDRSPDFKSLCLSVYSMVYMGLPALKTVRCHFKLCFVIFLLVLLDGALFWESFKCALLHVTRGQGGYSGQNESQTGGDVEENNVFSKVRCVNFLSLLFDLVFFFTDGVQYSKRRWFCVAWRYFSKSPWSVINKISLKVNRYI